jgi:ATP-dependent DNA ligase
MTMNLDITIVPGLRPTFFPMRPTTGYMIRTVDTIKRILDQVATGSHVIQPKLNGDRGTLTVLDGQVYIFNRHGSAYKMTVVNREDYSTLPDKTVLDGEIIDRHFTPFEAIVVGGKSLMDECVTVRIAEAKVIAEKYDEWLFETPSLEWLVENFKTQVPLNNRCRWEGVVKKATKKPYTPMGSDSQDSPDWWKHKWVK